MANDLYRQPMPSANAASRGNFHFDASSAAGDQAMARKMPHNQKVSGALVM